MFVKLTCFCILIFFSLSDASVMLWSNKHLEISPLQVFNDKALARLSESLNNPKIIIFQGDLRLIEGNLPKILREKESSYVPSADLTAENVSIISSLEPNVLESIGEQLEARSEQNYLVIIMDEKRTKRSIVDVTEMPPDIPADGVLYTDLHGIAMIYSSKPLNLTMNDRSDILGKATSVTLDKRGSYTNVLVTIPFDDGKIVLKFKFLWSSGYWSFSFLEVLTTDSRSFNLTSNTPISAPKKFSYHCKDITTFTSEDGNATLQLFDMQIQPDAERRSFGDAYDCVPFMTGPIWSGLFVTFLLIMVLSLGISALGSIKTMDKFETNKSKQLIISVNE